MSDKEGVLSKSYISETLDLPPSCIEFSQMHPEYFVVGTYNLEKDDEADKPVENKYGEEDEGVKDKKKQERNGSLLLYRLENDLL